MRAPLKTDCRAGSEKVQDDLERLVPGSKGPLRVNAEVMSRGTEAV